MKIKIYAVKFPKSKPFGLNHDSIQRAFLLDTEQVVGSETEVRQEIQKMGNGKWLSSRLDYFGV